MYVHIQNLRIFNIQHSNIMNESFFRRNMMQHSFIITITTIIEHGGWGSILDNTLRSLPPLRIATLAATLHDCFQLYNDGPCPPTIRRQRKPFATAKNEGEDQPNRR